MAPFFFTPRLSCPSSMLFSVILKSRGLFCQLMRSHLISGTLLIALGYFPRKLASLTQPAATAPAATLAVTHFFLFITFIPNKERQQDRRLLRGERSLVSATFKEEVLRAHAGERSELAQWKGRRVLECCLTGYQPHKYFRYPSNNIVESF